MSSADSHWWFILLASTLVERTLKLIERVVHGNFPKVFETRSHPMKPHLEERMSRLRIMISEWAPQSQVQAELAVICSGVLDDSGVLTDEILNLNIARLYEELCPGSMMLGSFIKSTVQTLNVIEDLVTWASTGEAWEWSDYTSCVQNLREEWSDAKATHNAVKLHLLVTFI